MSDADRATTSTATEPLIRNISDTALWVAVYRARETERSNALFRDPYARRLAGERGQRIVEALPNARREWPLITRTYLFDAFIREQVAKGVDLVLNLAAGLDARPYRMDLPPALRWVEVDLPGILDYKEEILGDAKPVCVFERIRLDLTDAAARRDLFARLGRESKNALVLTEGLLIYLTADEAAALARDLATPPSFKHWVIDIQSPALMRMLQKETGPHLEAAKSTFKFAPSEGPRYFQPHGWDPADVRPLLKNAARIKRLPFMLRLLALLPDQGPQGNAPWAAVCLLARR